MQSKLMETEQSDTTSISGEVQNRKGLYIVDGVLTL